MSFFKFDTDQELIEKLKRKLGHPIIKVELDASHWTDVVDSTKRWFMAKKSLIACKTMTHDPSGGGIPFSTIDTTHGVYKVVDVYHDETIKPTGADDCTYYELLPHGFPLWGGGSYYGMYSSNLQTSTSFMYQLFQRNENRRKIHGNDPDWFIKWDDVNGHSLHLTPVNSNTRTIAIVYKPIYLPINLLVGRNAQLFYDWALAESKEILGTIRSKYKDYPSAGGTVSTDGPELLEQAKEAKEKLEQEIADSQGPMPIILG